jgi:hypothetical protein
LRLLANTIRWLLFKIGYFPASDEQQGIPFDTKENRIEAIRNFIDENEWVVFWWLVVCVGQILKVSWYYQTAFLDDPALLIVKTDGRENFKMRLVVILEACFRLLIDHDLDADTTWKGGQLPSNSVIGRQVNRRGCYF